MSNVCQNSWKPYVESVKQDGPLPSIRVELSFVLEIGTPGPTEVLRNEIAFFKLLHLCFWNMHGNQVLKSLHKCYGVLGKGSVPFILPLDPYLKA